MENLIFGMIVVISNREVGVAMRDLNQTVEFIKEIENVGMAITSQTEDIAVADKKIYT